MILGSLLSLSLLPFSLAAPFGTSRRSFHTRRSDGPAPIKRSLDSRAQAVDPNAYIVTLKANSVDPTNREGWLATIMTEGGLVETDNHCSNLRLAWNETVMNGIAGTFSAEALDAIRAQPEVDFIEPDYEMKISAVVQQNNAPWGISRVSTGTVSLNGFDPLTLQFPYFADDSAGAGTDIYVLDTGIRATHAEFEGRATFLETFGPGVPGQDINGHGTHVSGTAAGKTVGIAKKASIFMIKVTSDQGAAATSDIISGINLAAQRAAQNPTRPAVVNMSLGGPGSRTMDAAVSNAVAQGLPFCVAAGNDAVDAGGDSPGRVPEVITVGATTINDTLASFSNFGSVVDVLAPGDTIISASNQGDDLGAVLSGTSMASPHIAGLSALIMGQSGKLTPDQLSTQIKQLAQNGAIGGVPTGTDNTLAFNNALNANQLQELATSLASAAGKAPEAAVSGASTTDTAAATATETTATATGTATETTATATGTATATATETTATATSTGAAEEGATTTTATATEGAATVTKTVTVSGTASATTSSDAAATVTVTVTAGAAEKTEAATDAETNRGGRIRDAIARIFSS